MRNKLLIALGLAVAGFAMIPTPAPAPPRPLDPGLERQREAVQRRAEVRRMAADYERLERHLEAVSP